MYTKKLSLWVAGVVFLGLSQMTYANCNAKIGAIKHLFDDFENYHAQQANDAKKRLHISVRDTQDCQLYMVLTSKNQNRLKGQFQEIPYYVRSDIQQTISSSVTRLNLVNSSVDIELFIPAGTPVKAGSYSDRLELKLYDSNSTLLDEREFEIKENILPRTSLSVVGYSSSSNVINLGELVSGREYTMLPTFKVVTNADVQLSVNSENRGRLIHSLYKNKYAIDYSLHIDGDRVNLLGESKRKFSYKGQTVFLLKLGMQLGEFQRKAAGEYSDTIRFHVAPLNY
ncbi:hypothetical protein [Marinomonas pollencensis]|uniref:Uncharacterized protein n=1 Tax=Marinomonas pollencensis TaxID=491954 RepID=A0A3E0DSY9_9GAMM|nr:hypothetical protein [Marinomonas pollencensis]REG86642.1 hypothetical protein DFP81_101207 [Marinomonas pollencensis]